MEGSTAHPRPLLRRATWSNLNGPWDFAFDPARQWKEPAAVSFDRTIEVPYAPETPRSGIHDEGFHPVVWYRKTVPAAGPGARVFLHFGAVDYRAEVWVNGHFLARHEGGHTPFTVEVTGLAKQAPELTIVVRAEDEPGALDQPRGKQDWQLRSHSIWYPRTTGIWQTVWLEYTPETYLRSLQWTPDLEHFSLRCEAEIDGMLEPDDFLRVQLFVRDRLVADDSFRLQGPSVVRSFHLYDGGLEDVRQELLWSPEHPQLIEVKITLGRGDEVLDRVESYTALRSAGFDEIAFLLNGRAYPLRLVLDQGYWPASGLSATDEELRQDVLLTKRLGFNGARKHQKIEDPRYLYWCDRLGLLVWEEMPSAYAFSSRAVEGVTAEWVEAIAR
ncbi:MAG TPA: beta galactosidase jelly roll domain-containing protein, partial [Chthoniobacterales bacterium]